MVFHVGTNTSLKITSASYTGLPVDHAIGKVRLVLDGMVLCHGLPLETCQGHILLRKNA